MAGGMGWDGAGQGIGHGRALSGFHNNSDDNKIKAAHGVARATIWEVEFTEVINQLF
jgi:hypothetical protein